MHFSKGQLIRLALALSLAGCALGKDDTLSGACQAEDPAITAQRDAAFAATLQPVFSKYACNSCHDGVSGKAPYSFASSDASVGQPFARKFINEDNPADSRLVEKVGVENHNCGGTCATVASEIQSQITAWMAAEVGLPELACSNGEKITVTLPAQKIVISELSATPKTFRFDLSDATPAMPGAGFEIRAKLQTPPSGITNGAYNLIDPRFAFQGGNNYRISNIQISVNGAVDLGAANFTLVDFVVTPTPFIFSAVTWPFPVVSDGTQLMLVQNLAGDDVAFSFELSQTREEGDTNAIAVGCKAEGLFLTNVKPIYSRCTSCHARPSDPARNAFSMAGDVDLCSQSLARTSFADPLQSVLIIHPNNEDMLFHPALATLNKIQPAEKNAIKAWIDAEAAAASN